MLPLLTSKYERNCWFLTSYNMFSTNQLPTETSKGRRSAPKTRTGCLTCKYGYLHPFLGLCTHSKQIPSSQMRRREAALSPMHQVRHRMRRLSPTTISSQSSSRTSQVYCINKTFIRSQCSCNMSQVRCTTSREHHPVAVCRRGRISMFRQVL